MKAVGVRTQDEVSRSSSSLKTSASSSASHLSESVGAGNPEPTSISMDDLSSSDDEMHYEAGVTEQHASGQPVVLEDYTTDQVASGQDRGDGPDGRKKSVPGSSAGVRMSDFEGQNTNREDPEQERTVIPESASFDSGVEVNRGESETRVGEDSTLRAAAKPVSASDCKLEDSTAGNSDGMEGAQSLKDQTTDRQDRTADAGDNGKESSDDDQAQGGDRADEGEDDTSSNLQRKKMFDSMYRLVLDDDLLEVMNEEGVDDEALLAEKEDEGSS